MVPRLGADAERWAGREPDAQARDAPALPFLPAPSEPLAVWVPCKPDAARSAARSCVAAGLGFAPAFPVPPAALQPELKPEQKERPGPRWQTPAQGSDSSQAEPPEAQPDGPPHSASQQAALKEARVA